MVCTEASPSTSSGYTSTRSCDSESLRAGGAFKTPGSRCAHFESRKSASCGPNVDPLGHPGMPRAVVGAAAPSSRPRFRLSSVAVCAHMLTLTDTTESRSEIILPPSLDTRADGHGLRSNQPLRLPAARLACLARVSEITCSRQVFPKRCIGSAATAACSGSWHVGWRQVAHAQRLTTCCFAQRSRLLDVVSPVRHGSWPKSLSESCAMTGAAGSMEWHEAVPHHHQRRACRAGTPAPLATCAPRVGSSGSLAASRRTSTQRGCGLVSTWR